MNDKVVSKDYPSEDYLENKDLLSRWIALMEGIELIESKAVQLKISKARVDELMKPLALQKYIAERYVSIKSEIEYFENQPA